MRKHGPLIATLATALTLTLVPAATAAPIPTRSNVELGAAVTLACATQDGATPACPVAPFEPGYLQAWQQRFDRLTPENELKMLFTQPQQNRFNFSVADRLVGLAASSGRKVRGHTLIYPAANPAWINRGPLLFGWSRSSLLTAMRKHISTVVGHYRAAFPGTIDQWDVVNEPFLANGARDPNVYQRIIGDAWIEEAFRAADAADPNALLFLNEFDADEHGTPRQQAVSRLVRDFVNRGVPIDGVGLEMHVGVDGHYPTLASLKATMKEYADMGLRVSVTEADILRPIVDDGGLTQRAVWSVVADACRQSPNCTGFTVWGVADRYSWRGADQKATLLNSVFTPKVAYSNVRCRLANPWPTRTAPATDPCAPVPAVPAGSTPLTVGPTSGPSTGSA